MRLIETPEQARTAIAFGLFILLVGLWVAFDLGVALIVVGSVLTAGGMMNLWFLWAVGYFDDLEGEV